MNPFERRFQRNNRRNNDRKAQRKREFSQQPSCNAAHKQARDEYGDQRQADRDNGESDLSRADERRFEATHAMFNVLLNVFNHHDGAVRGPDDDAPIIGWRG